MRHSLAGNRLTFAAIATALLAASLTGWSGSAERAEAAPIGWATTDFNCDGYGDLAASGHESGGKGYVTVLYGGPDGLSTYGAQEWTLGSFQNPLPWSSTHDEFGATLAPGDFNGDGCTDLAVGSPEARINDLSSAGGVTVIYGSAQSGLRITLARHFTQDSTGILDAAETGDRFGETLAAGNLGNGPEDDLVIGAPRDSVIWSEGDEGRVHVIFGSGLGLAPAGNQVFTQNTVGVLDAPEPQDEFGSALAVADFGKGSTEDLAIGVRGEDLEFEGRNGPTSIADAGLVHVLYGSDTGVAIPDNQLLTQSTPGVPGAPEAYEGFGRSLVAADFGSSGHADLAIGVPLDNPGGGVNVVYGSGSGLTGSGSQLWTQDSPGIIGSSEDADTFGSQLAAGNVGNGAVADLVIAADNESNAATHDGVVHVIFGSSGGLVETGNQLWGQDSSGIAGTAEDYDRFGSGALQVNNFGHSVEADIAIGTPLETYAPGLLWDGVVQVIYGALLGPTSANDQLFSPADSLVPGDADNDGRFGGSLA